MVQVLHGRTTTAEAVRRAIQHSQESLRVLAKRYGINQKTVAKWKKRTAVADLSAGLKDPKSTALTVEEEAIIVALHRDSPHA
jgi:DNA-binding transcriptional regulator YiaG